MKVNINMMIQVKEAALEQLQKIQFSKNEGIRILTEQEQSCSLFTDYNLAVSTANDGDEIIENQKIPFIISEYTKGILPEKVYLNYSPNLGYKLYSDEEILKANMQLKRQK
jgi:uncharacterized protein YqkB